jgi:uncharacterized protein
VRRLSLWVLLAAALLNARAGVEDDKAVLHTKHANAAADLQQAAERGDLLSQIRLGGALARSSSLTNDNEAAAWYRKAANQPNVKSAVFPLAEAGDHAAQTVLGMVYALGNGVPRDAAEAIKWFRLAADQGDTVAMVSMASAFNRGAGVPRDDVESLKWFRMAAERDSVMGQDGLGYMLAAGQGAAKDEAQAAHWFRKAAERGYSNAQVNLAALYREGRGVPVDFAQAMAWYQKAAEQGDIRAKNALEELGAGINPPK